MDRKITLTQDRLEKSKTPKGGYNAKQLRQIGVGWPPQKGWKKKLTGTKVTLEKFYWFVYKSGNTDYLSEIQSYLEKNNLSIKKAEDKRRQLHKKITKNQRKERSKKKSSY